MRSYRPISTLQDAKRRLNTSSKTRAIACKPNQPIGTCLESLRAPILNTDVTCLQINVHLLAKVQDTRLVVTFTYTPHESRGQSLKRIDIKQGAEHTRSGAP